MNGCIFCLKYETQDAADFSGGFTRHYIEDIQRVFLTTRPIFIYQKLLDHNFVIISLLFLGAGVGAFYTFTYTRSYYLFCKNQKALQNVSLMQQNAWNSSASSPHIPLQPRKLFISCSFNFYTFICFSVILKYVYLQLVIV